MSGGQRSSAYEDAESGGSRRGAYSRSQKRMSSELEQEGAVEDAGGVGAEGRGERGPNGGPSSIKRRLVALSSEQEGEEREGGKEAAEKGRDGADLEGDDA